MFPVSSFKSLTLIVFVMFGVVHHAVADVVTPEVRGNWIQGGLLQGKLAKGQWVEFQGKRLPLTASGEFMVGLGRDFPESASLLVGNEQGEQQTFTYPVEARSYNIQRIEGVPQKTVTPPAEQLARIRKEAASVASARNVVLPLEFFREAFQWPLVGPITGVYGSQRVYNGKPGRPHFGVDVAQPTGTRVVAPAGGKVTLVNDDMFFSGGTLIIDHGYGLSSTFIHLSKILVDVGQEIHQGQEIAEVGATGRATGPHLDWRMNWFDQRIDPQLLAPAMVTPEASK